MTTYYVIKHDDEGNESVVKRTPDPAIAQQYVQEQRRQLPFGSSTYFTVSTQGLSMPEQLKEDEHRSGSSRVPRNCADIRREVAKRPYRAGERAYLIKKAIELGCTDSIPDSWMIQFRRMNDNG